MEKKYRLTEETIEWCGSTLHRIEALKDFGNVKKGDKGGWIESEENLSQEGNCWVGGNAKVWGDTQVSDNEQVDKDTEVYGARVYGCARVADWVAEQPKVFGSARLG